MDKIETMRRFIAVVHTGSFTQAAEQLNVPKSAISASISQLENHLQTRLLQRSTRRVTLTDVGERYLPECQALLSELEELETRFQQQSQQLSGVIKIDMPSRFFSTLVAPNLPSWFALHPNTQIRLLGADYRIDPIKEQVDCVIRAGTLQDSNLVAKRLGTMTMINCVSPGYLRQYGCPQTLRDLSAHFVVDYSPTVRHAQNGFEYHADGETQFVAVPSLVSVSTTDAYLAAALSGLGIIQLPRAGVEALLAQGELVEVLSQWRCAPMPVSVLYPSRKQQPRRVREFIDWLCALQPNAS